MSEEIYIKGLDELQHKLETLPRELARKIIRDDLKEVGGELAKRMADAAPERTGFLASHFNAKVSIRQDELAGRAMVGPQGKMYYPSRGEAKRGIATGKYPHKGGLVSVVSVARFLEFGTSHERKQPFMVQAFDAYEDEALQKIIEGIRDELAKW